MEEDTAAGAEATAAVETLTGVSLEIALFPTLSLDQTSPTYRKHFSFVPQTLAKNLCQLLAKLGRLEPRERIDRLCLYWCCCDDWCNPKPKVLVILPLCSISKVRERVTQKPKRDPPLFFILIPEQEESSWWLGILEAAAEIPTPPVVMEVQQTLAALTIKKYRVGLLNVTRRIALLFPDDPRQNRDSP